jgi:hypothetical protein
MEPLTISLVSACTALVASILGPVVALLIAKRQINANVVSSNRQKWIESLRDLIAEFVSQLVTVLVVKSGWRGNWDRGLPAIQSDRAYLEKLERMVLVQSKIRLLLNPNEADHQALYRVIEAALEHSRSEQMHETEIASDIETIAQLAQGILKREWRRVKRGD